MLTLEDFIAKYEAYTDEELYIIYQDAANYSEDAGKALNIIIEKKGGLESLIKRLEEKTIIKNEKNRIANEAVRFGMEGVDASFLQNTTHSSILSKQEVNEIIEAYAAKATELVEDKKVNSETVVKSLIGCGLASIFGGAFASLQFIYFGATSFLMVLGVALICYGTVKLVTQKSYNNTAVLLASFIAFILSYLLAYFAFLIFGYLG